jgi:hypothetical protein
MDGESRARAGISTPWGAFHPDAGIAELVARKIVEELFLGPRMGDRAALRHGEPGRRRRDAAAVTTVLSGGHDRCGRPR